MPIVGKFHNSICILKCSGRKWPTALQWNHFQHQLAQELSQGWENGFGFIGDEVRPLSVVQTRLENFNLSDNSRRELDARLSDVTQQ